MPKPTQAALKRDYTKFNSIFALRNRDKYIGFDGRYQGPENCSTPKKLGGTDPIPPLSSAYTNAAPIPLPDNQTIRKQMVEDRRRNNLFLWLSDRTYKPRKALNYESFAREIEIEHIQQEQRTPYEELSERFGSEAFIDEHGSPKGFQIKKIRRPERTAPAWMMSNENLKMLIRHLRYDKRGAHKGFTMERAIYLAYLYYRCHLNAGEIAGWVGSNYEWFGFKTPPDISQETVEGVIKRVTARGNRFFNKLQRYSDPPVTIAEGPDELSPEALAEQFELWASEKATELDEMSYIQ